MFIISQKADVHLHTNDTNTADAKLFPLCLNILRPSWAILGLGIERTGYIWDDYSGVTGLI